MSSPRATPLAIAALLLSAPGASAATASLKYEAAIPGVEPDAAYTLTVRDRAGHNNQLAISRNASGYVVRDFAAPLTAGAGCQALNANEARCATPRRGADHSVFVVAGGGGDIVSTAGLPATATAEVQGGRGQDLLAGGVARDIFVGGESDDWLAAAGNDDDLDGGLGNDRLDGGDGRDVASYQDRRATVRADLHVGLAGQAGELDRLSGIEDLLGGRGADELSGDAGLNMIHGGRGDARDVVTGRGGDDTLLGYTASGGAGDDRLDAQRFECGAGLDLLERLAHRTRGPFPRACEMILGDFVFMKPDPVQRGARRLVFAIKCPFEDVACAARVDISDSRGHLGSTRVRIHAPPSGPFKRVTVPLRRGSASRVGRLELRGQKAFDRDWFRIRLR